MQRGAGEGSGGRKILLLDQSIDVEAGGMYIAMAGDFDLESIDVTVGGTADLDGEFFTKLGGIGRGGDPAIELGPACSADGVDLLVRPAVLRDCLAGDPSGSVR